MFVILLLIDFYSVDIKINILVVISVWLMGAEKGYIVLCILISFKCTFFI